MKNKVLAAQQEDAARRLVRTALSREGFSPVPGEESGAVEAGERKVIITYQIRVTGSDSTAPFGNHWGAGALPDAEGV